MNIPDLMAEYINKNVGKRDIEKYKRYCKNLWNSNKSGLAVFFLSKIKNINEEEQLIIFNNTMKEYIDMIKKIYKFIEKSNN